MRAFPLDGKGRSSGGLSAYYSKRAGHMHRRCREYQFYYLLYKGFDTHDVCHVSSNLHGLNLVLIITSSLLARAKRSIPRDLDV